MAEHDFDAARSRLTSQSIDPLVFAARNGHANSLGQLTERCRRYLLHVARRELQPDLRAKVAPSDLVQQTLMAVQRNFHQFRGETKEEFQAWLREILLNQARGATRFFKATSKRDIRRETSIEGDGGATALVDIGESPSKQALTNERMQSLAMAILRLPTAYRQVIELRSQEQRSFDEIGHLMSRSAAAARSLWIRALDALRAEIEHYDDSV